MKLLCCLRDGSQWDVEQMTILELGWLMLFLLLLSALLKTHPSINGAKSTDHKKDQNPDHHQIPMISFHVLH